MMESQAVHKMSTKQAPNKQQHQHKACYRCGSEQHRAGDCRFIKETCHRCGKTGHIQKVCRSKCSASTSKISGVEYMRQGSMGKLREQTMSARGRKKVMA